MLGIKCCSDVAKLARASVSGDESALDMFSWKGAPLKMGPQEGLAFYVSTADGKSQSFLFQNVDLVDFLLYCATVKCTVQYIFCLILNIFPYIGKVHCIDEHCKTSTLVSVEGAVKKLFFFEKREVLAVITETMMLSQYTLGSEGGAQEYMKVFNPVLFMRLPLKVFYKIIFSCP